MANVAHSGLTGSNLHENKGVASATDNTVATALSGATTWAKLTNANLTYGQLLHAREQQATATASSLTVSPSTWTKLVLNTSVTSEIASCSINTGTSVLTLVAGTYEVEAYSTGFTSYTQNKQKLRLRNTTDNTTVMVGRHVVNAGEQGSIGSISAANQPTLKGRLILAGTKTLELQIWHNDSSPLVLGLNANGADGEVEIYSEIYIKKIV